MPRSRHPIRPLLAGLAFLLLAGCGAIPAGPMAGAGPSGQATTSIQSTAEAVVGWTDVANVLGGGSAANWRTLVIMHIAMHDAVNAAEPRYARIMPRLPDEPRGAAPPLAMAAAAFEVLQLRHPEHAGLVAGQLYRRAIAATPRGPAQEAALRLGAAIGQAAATRYRDTTEAAYPFSVSTTPGKWRATPPRFAVAVYGEDPTFVSGSYQAARSLPPPELGSPAYLALVEEVRRVGGTRDHTRTAAQSEAAIFWAQQTTQASMQLLAIRLLRENPLPGGIWEMARAMAALNMALVDSYLVTWESKEHFSYWRPVTAINAGGFGVTADPAWAPYIETPPHPEHPSGHAADCGTGAAVLQGVMGSAVREITYVAADTPGQPARRFPSLTAAAEECASSRLWAGVHFRTANDEGLRLGRTIAARALALMQPVGATVAAR